MAKSKLGSILLIAAAAGCGYYLLNNNGSSSGESINLDGAKETVNNIIDGVKNSFDNIDLSGAKETVNGIIDGIKDIPQYPDNHSDNNVIVGGIRFPLPEDYELVDRRTVENGETCLIQPIGGTGENRLIVSVLPNILEGINGLTNEEVGQMLSAFVDSFVGTLADGDNYKVVYDDNANGTYFPCSYCYYNWVEDGFRHLSYTEALLVEGNIVSGCAIAIDEGELAALTDIMATVTTSALL